MGILSLLDLPVSFFFISRKGKACLSVYRCMIPASDKALNFYPGDFIALSKAKRCYEIEIRRGFGFGFLASFIPWTDPFRARIYYVKSLRATYKNIRKGINDLERIDFFSKVFFKLVTTPFYFSKIIDPFFKEYSFTIATAINNIQYNRKDSIFKILSYFPILSDIFHFSYDDEQWHLKKDAFWNVFHTMRNPLRLVKDFLRFLERFIERFIETKTTQGEDSFIVQKILKSITVAFFLPLRFFVATLVAIVDAFWSFMHSFTIKIVQFFISSIYQTYYYWNKAFILTNEENLRMAKVIRKIIKNKEEDFEKEKYSEVSSKIKNKTNETTEYLVSDKKTIYRGCFFDNFYIDSDDNYLKNNHIVIATSPEKSDDTKRYIRFFKQYKRKHPDFKINSKVDEEMILKLRNFELI